MTKAASLAEKLRKDLQAMTPEQAEKAWNAVVDMYICDEAEEGAAMSPEAIDRELHAAGFDPALERAKGWAITAVYGAEAWTPAQIAKARENLVRAAPRDAAERVAALTDADFVRALRDIGRAVFRALGKEDALVEWLAARSAGTPGNPVTALPDPLRSERLHGIGELRAWSRSTRDRT